MDTPDPVDELSEVTPEQRRLFLDAADAARQRPTRQADIDRAVVEAVEALADEWYGDEEEGVAHVAACQDYGCKDCVVIACATDLRAAIAAASEPTSVHDEGGAT